MTRSTRHLAVLTHRHATSQGYVGLALSSLSIVYFQLQIKTFVFLSQRMRDSYATGVKERSPAMDDGERAT